ncbi:hypothetical protein Tco_0905538 [Tanacetum coccineum]
MSTHSGPSPIAPPSDVQNTIGREKEMSQRNLNRPASDAALKEYCDKHYNQLFPILAEKMHQEKVHKEKLKAVKAHLNFKEVSQHFDSGTPSRMRDLRKRIGSRRICSVSRSPEPRRGRSESPRKRDPERKIVFKRLEKGVFHRLGDKGKTTSSIEDDDLSQPWVCEETDSFTPRICYFDLPKRTHMPSHVKTYDKSEDPEDHLKIFQAAVKVERWAMSTWCHMFNSMLTGSARKKCIKDPVEIHHIKQREGESTKDFVRRLKVESRDVKGASEIMRISGFMHGITNPKLIKRLHDKIPKSVEEMIRITTSFLRGRSERRQDKFTLLSKSPKELLALEKGKFKAPPLMTTPVKKNSNKFCKFHGEVGHNTDECMHLKRQIEELLKNGKLPHVIKELKQNSGNDQPKANKKREASSKDKALGILMVQPWKEDG